MSTLPPPAQRFVAESPPHGVLVVLTGPEAGKVIALDPTQPNTIGRAEESRIRFPADSVSDGVSRRHAQITFEEGGYLLTDTTSTHGIYVNGEKQSAPRLLCKGDNIQIGASIVLRFFLVTPDEEQALRELHEGQSFEDLTIYQNDKLTGLSTLRHLEKWLNDEIQQAVQAAQALSLLVIDLDHFKHVNDHYNMPNADTVLQLVSQRLKAFIGPRDLAARHLGTRFALVFPGLGATEATALAEKVRRAIADTPFAAGDCEIPLTVSIGVASLVEGGEQADKATLLRIADERQAEAKRRGRNCVVGARGRCGTAG